ncbi:cell envelope-related function transcriptional attenuator [Mycobacterium bohemicum DSM 44277]|uniref:Transcriptional regulator n=2 Tax=Mycobacterium bohemicum TaxID=56425 RepID=A0A1X1RAD6_MYCBE|nr:LCP family protein [Mycobacterium bohemicum]MCV6968647.1 LCP family protein [Mycobacterium bohemicum]ORV02162.1 transcriptional regulator [Mycobacterium bohemicum]CPR12996.1 cell envelope-related function transcriptional attenuator [Mycobacterium bohemicum DSM 44277]
MGSGESEGSGRLVLLKGRLMASLASAFVMAITGVGWTAIHTAVGRIITSHALPDAPTTFGADQNILLMGLDSRLDQNGHPLPQEMYEALHAGDETSGGYNANVLIVVHLSGDAGPITAVSIPRDDYVQLSGCPGSVCMGKIKQAYGLAYQQSLEDQVAGGSNGAGATDLAAREQAAREEGRKAEIGTVRDLLGISVDHFIEVTLGAFFEIARVVEPITVCVNADTADTYSGADFHQGVQQIDAAQAMAFVRQRRAANDGSFTDFDRTRRQQAFLVSLVKAARKGGALSSAGALRTLLQVARDSVAVDAGLDLVDLVAHAATLIDRPLSLYTLPISEFGRDANGSDVNLIDVPTIRRIVQERFTSDTPAAPDAAPPNSQRTPALAKPVVLDVVNATSRDGLAAAIESEFAGRGFTRGSATTAAAPQDDSTVEYGAGASEGAQILADQLHVPATGSDTLPSGTVRLTVGRRFPADDYFSHPGASLDTSASGKVTAVAASGAGADAPAPTDLSQMTAAGIPCVK